MKVQEKTAREALRALEDSTAPIGSFQRQTVGDWDEQNARNIMALKDFILKEYADD